MGPDGPMSAEVVRDGDAFLVKVEGVEYRIRLKPTDEQDTIVAEVSDRPIQVKVLSAGSRGVELEFGGERVFFEKAKPRAMASVPLQVAGEPEKRLQDVGTLISPMPGKVMSVMAKAGDAVKLGDALVVIESMKMEVAVRSDRDGTVDQILVSEGGSVKKGQALAKFVT